MWHRFIDELNGLTIPVAKHYTCRAALFGKAHRHPDQFHLMLIVAGRGAIGIEKMRYDVKAGDAVVVRPGQVHASYGDRRHDYELVEVKFSLKSRTGDDAVPEFPAVFHVHNTPKVLTALDRFVEAHLIGSADSDWLARVRLAEALMVLWRELHPLPETSGLAGDMDRKIRQALEHIALKFDEPMTVEDLAELVGLSGSHFASSFRRHTGVSPIEMLIATRLRHARELLADSTLPVGQIASVCGFSSSQYFARIFRQREGLSPLQYRRKRRGASLR